MKSKKPLTICLFFLFLYFIVIFFFALIYYTLSWNYGSDLFTANKEVYDRVLINKVESEVFKSCGFKSGFIGLFIHNEKYVEVDRYIRYCIDKLTADLEYRYYSYPGNVNTYSALKKGNCIGGYWGYLYYFIYLYTQDVTHFSFTLSDTIRLKNKLNKESIDVKEVIFTMYRLKNKQISDDWKKSINDIKDIDNYQIIDTLQTFICKEFNDKFNQDEEFIFKAGGSPFYFEDCFTLFDHLNLKIIDICMNLPDIMFIDYLYFSVVTITTLGYGDIVPNSPTVRIYVSIEVILGIMIMGLFITFLFQSIYIRDKKENTK